MHSKCQNSLTLPCLSPKPDKFRWNDRPIKWSTGRDSWISPNNRNNRDHNRSRSAKPWPDRSAIVQPRPVELIRSTTAFCASPHLPEAGTCPRDRQSRASSPFGAPTPALLDPPPPQTHLNRTPAAPPPPPLPSRPHLPVSRLPSRPRSSPAPSSAGSHRTLSSSASRCRSSGTIPPRRRRAGGGRRGGWSRCRSRPRTSQWRLRPGQVGRQEGPALEVVACRQTRAVFRWLGGGFRQGVEVEVGREAVEEEEDENSPEEKGSPCGHGCSILLFISISIYWLGWVVSLWVLLVIFSGPYILESKVLFNRRWRHWPMGWCHVLLISPSQWPLSDVINHMNHTLADVRDDTL